MDILVLGIFIMRTFKICEKKKKGEVWLYMTINLTLSLSKNGMSQSEDDEYNLFNKKKLTRVRRMPTCIYYYINTRWILKF